MIRFPSLYIERAIVFGLGIACVAVIGLTALSVSDRAGLPPGAEKQSLLRPAFDQEPALSAGEPVITYASYEPRVLRLKQPMVLFFSKSTDLFSLQHDTLIQSLAAAQALRIATYRVDFDSGTGARLAFGVVVPDTFVRLDAQGQRTSLMIHPTAEAFR